MLPPQSTVKLEPPGVHLKYQVCHTASGILQPEVMPPPPMDVTCPLPIVHAAYHLEGKLHGILERALGLEPDGLSCNSDLGCVT